MISVLACPADQTNLRAHDGGLLCDHGHHFAASRVLMTIFSIAMTNGADSALPGIAIRKTIQSKLVPLRLS